MWREKVAAMMRGGDSGEERAICRLLHREKDHKVIEAMYDSLDELTGFREESTRLLQKYASYFEG